MRLKIGFLMIHRFILKVAKFQLHILKRFSIVNKTIFLGAEAEIWGAYGIVDFDTWDTLPTEQTHLQFRRCIIGVNISATNLMCHS